MKPGPARKYHARHTVHFSREQDIMLHAWAVDGDISKAIRERLFGARDDDDQCEADDSLRPTPDS